MKRIVNLDSLQPGLIGARLPGAPALYDGAAVAPIAPLVGARRLGYNLTVVPPGKAAFPFHSHYGNEEMFFILEGRGELRYGDERHPLRAGDVVACPPGGPDSAHQIRNTSVDAELRYLAVSTTQSPDMFHYPDSGKTGASHYPESGDAGVVRLRNRIDHNLDYWDGE
ncbi:hypothetical protein GCM10010960_17960 [Arenimonas maotaiensis]|uniref:Cupin type-2 domain-containing protein n=1 Tax=Arenimonas maotaiensis TaxID=1446479 RepID=A0A917CR40_9GAMM|nr:cupin domain-containing protein [Arenimonas maotaiensis]GGF96741.1 hypothetical protein GCM10010960_17960 [Arenimonas maotaiensis]